MTDAAVRQLIAGRSNALRRRDADSFLASYADDALIFDLAPPLVHGVDREGVAAWMRTWDGSTENDVDLHLVKVSGAMAFAAGLERLAGTQGGETRDIWFRFTLSFANTAGGWRLRPRKLRRASRDRYAAAFRRRPLGAGSSGAGSTRFLPSPILLASSWRFAA